MTTTVSDFNADQIVNTIKVELAKQLAGIEGISFLSIYITGSFARGDAHRNSDIDIFFIYDDIQAGRQFSKISANEVFTKVINICREMRLPEFSNDGEFLFKMYTLSNMTTYIGKPEDDYHNYFTARLLMLLESECVYNDIIFSKYLNEIINSYFRDYDNHPEDFKPIYLINDIVRFWKTLCLNYEMRRNDESSRGKGKHAIKNLKLKYSRLLTCYTLIIPLCKHSSCSRENLISLVNKKPMQRLEGILTEDDLEKLKADYDEFLRFTHDADKAKELMLEKENRDSWSAKGEEFGAILYAILNKQADPSVIRYVAL
ncbi:nucleotidyltransferase domain-containing protein [Deinococcus soli (ex Cha et al. 2016)]|uniref:nucleotidyltransferase domain-containing protein n=1 Tax=Deinococcus soli (ex Cha et al. 2016) TaxID=1309411 RepID=UPI00166D187F|nr:nucleotidyltransferase domain-containing protein [Deinococcus soli (ex Cha et al. 2016)]GGB77359.1 hypothetical protein GCM10008019_36990 [Deinococcus soli (ex Cha et al. 2016)]